MGNKNSSNINSSSNQQGLRSSLEDVSNKQQEQAQFYNDDDPIVQSAKTQKKEATKIQIQIKAQRTMVKLKQKVDLPTMCSIKTSGGVRSSVDLICVIDVSGSMSGEKIQLVKSTMKYLLQTLTPADRLSIITFNSSGRRICGLKAISAQNLVKLNQHVDSLIASGGTNINAGLEIALKTIRDRKVPNKVTSIFLLSDGQDGSADVRFGKILQKPINKQLGVFSIHSFGFGTDHDENLMTKISNIKDGNFYFIKQYQTLDQAFANALGGIISIVAKDMVIKVNNISKNIVEGVKINKTYGNMWEKINERQYRIKILQLMSGISKDYVFELGIPYINTQVGDLDRDHDVIQAIYQAKSVNGDNIVGQCIFKITLINSNEEIPQMNQNSEVVQNYLRVKAAEVIQQTMKKAQNQKYEQAQGGIDNMIKDIKSNKRARQEKMEGLVNDLQTIRQKCQPQVFKTQGRKQMQRAYVEHQKQVSYNYSNSIQHDMVQERRMRKKG